MALSTTQKLLLGSIVAGGSIFGLVKLVKYIKSNSEKKDSEEIVEDNILNADPTVRKLTDEKCKEIANRLYELMDKTFRQSDAIVSIISNGGMSLADLKVVYEDFGSKEYGTFGSPVFGSGTYKDLIGWLKEELDSDGLATVKGIFSMAGFTWVD